MKLDRVTITGADDSIEIPELANVAAKFPFVEWGILVSARQCGSPRFPTRQWLAVLVDLATRHPWEFQRLSSHVCGRWVHNLLGGNTEPLLSELGALLGISKRVQLNFHGEPHTLTPAGIALLKSGAFAGKQIIFQIDGTDRAEDLFSTARDSGINAFPLFDTSGGAGILPKAWPKADYIDVIPGPEGEGIQSPTYHGYAGGLGPDSLAEQLPLIAEAAGESCAWIDMERRVRSADDRQFDLGKVRHCLGIAKDWIA